jgi:hypothetical protein
VTYQKLADAAVTTRAMANQAVDTSKLANLAVTAAQLANSSVEATKIANAAVGSAAIAQAAIGSAHIGEAAILTAHIGDAQIVDAKIGNLAVEKLIGTYITGKTIRTAASGARIELSADGFTVYDESGLKNGPYISPYDNSFNMFNAGNPIYTVEAVDGSAYDCRVRAGVGYSTMYVGNYNQYVTMEGAEVNINPGLLNVGATNDINLNSVNGMIKANGYEVATKNDLGNYVLMTYLGQNYATLGMINDMATETWILGQSYATQYYVNSYVNSYVSNALSGYALTSYVNSQIAAVMNWASDTFVAK